MKRIQCSRRRKDPPNTRRCVRPSKFGNDFKVGGTIPEKYYDRLTTKDQARFRRKWVILDAIEAIRLFKEYQLPYMNVHELRRYENLSCYCKPENPCHVDEIILKIENGKPDLGSAVWCFPKF